MTGSGSSGGPPRECIAVLQVLRKVRNPVQWRLIPGLVFHAGLALGQQKVEYGVRFAELFIKTSLFGLQHNVVAVIVARSRERGLSAENVAGRTLVLVFKDEDVEIKTELPGVQVEVPWRHDVLASLIRVDRLAPVLRFSELRGWQTLVRVADVVPARWSYFKIALFIAGGA